MEDEFWLYFLLALLVGLIIVFLLISIRVLWPDYHVVSKEKDTAIPTFRTGDIIGVRYRGEGQLTKSMSGSHWNHVGMIFLDSNCGGGGHTDPRCKGIETVHVVEITGWNKGPLEPTVSSLGQWLNRYRRHDLAVSRYQGPEIPTSAVREALVRHKGKRGSVKTISWIPCLMKRSWYEREANNYICSELVMLLLQDLGVAKKVYLADGYRPSEILFNKFECEAGRGYGAAEYLTWRPEALMNADV